MFYLLISIGGSLGGVLTAVVAPRLFTGFWEYQLGLAACCILFVAAACRDKRTPLPIARRATLTVGAVCGCVMLCSALGRQVFARDPAQIAAVRNFYGLLRVIDDTAEHGARRAMVHGRVVHGLQRLDDRHRRIPTTYYGLESGIGVALRRHSHVLRRSDPAALRVGVVGLGAGTLAAYGRLGDYYRFYEINADVIRSAHEMFTFLADTPATIDVVCGDARIVLERELVDFGSQRFDVLAVDAFSGDAVPMHLLTRECFDVYRRHLADDGVLMLHISNNCVDLAPVVAGLAAEIGFDVREIHSKESREEGLNEAIWLLVTRNAALLADVEVAAKSRPLALIRPALVWTDDFGSLRQVLK